MESFLKAQIPEQTWKNRLVNEDGLCFMDFGPLDVDRLGRLGIEVDSLGPKVLSCMWDEEAELEVGGYLVVDNLAMGRPSMGGIRMLPDLLPSTIHNLARGMTLKNAAANLPYGGGKAGIVADPTLPEDIHREIVRRFSRLIYRYRDIYLPGPDVGTNDADMKIVAIMNGLDNALSKPVDMGGNRIDQLGAAGGGLAIALEALLTELPRLNSLPQFANCVVPEKEEITVLLQGFGAVGANAARTLIQRIPEIRIIGISDATGYLFDTDGLPIDTLFRDWMNKGVVAKNYFQDNLLTLTTNSKIKYSSYPEDLLRESGFCFIPAAPIANYLDVTSSTSPSMTTEHMGAWRLIIEGANTYSPDAERKSARSRMEREVYRQRGILIVTDYLVNSGGVIFAAQEQLIKTPSHLRIPDEMLGESSKVDEWLTKHSQDFAELAEKRRIAAEKARDEVIKRNMHELLDILITDPDMLPCEAAESISISRITSREKDRKASDIMESTITIQTISTLQEAARLFVDTGCPILAVINQRNELVGVLSNWDITKAASRGPIEKITVEQAMTRQVISAKLDDPILDLVRKLEYYEISAMPVVEGKSVRGIVSTDILASRSLYRLLQAHEE
ncbi:MAG TPA: Glu/Leu/Phe/Val dehydrogenase dimerization domain-containing protein [Anaerolineales bacterium]|nr:Glu/Leu/Phe/Val dehydrogenase dimerization domain-containing protein [Anaerolineales bacterium]